MATGCGADAANERPVESDTPAEEVRNEVGEDTAPISDVTGYIDPVCGMKVAEDSPNRATHEGVTYGFCSGACKDQFTAAPAKYLAALDE